MVSVDGVITIGKELVSVATSIYEAFQTFKNIPAEIAEFHKNMALIGQLAQNQKTDTDLDKDILKELANLSAIGLRVGQKFVAAKKSKIVDFTWDLLQSKFMGQGSAEVKERMSKLLKRMRELVKILNASNIQKIANHVQEQVELELKPDEKGTLLRYLLSQLSKFMKEGNN
jgi:hypothetical protein